VNNLSQRTRISVKHPLVRRRWTFYEAVKGASLKFIHTADSHLGFEFTKTSQSDPGGRLRRSRTISKNFMAVVKYAINVDADLFIHSGDLFNKHYIPRETLEELIRPLADLARVGVSIVIIPGNHERSEFPFDLFHGLPNIFLFDRPKSIALRIDHYAVTIAGFPFIRKDSRRTFLWALEQTEYAQLRADLNILVTHQAFDEAKVGPHDFAFRQGRSDTVTRHHIPPHFDYVAAGHIHRYQRLPHPLKPGLNFVYPGSIQRMSFAEMDEQKGFVEAEVLNNRIETWFRPLPTYEMEMVDIVAAGLSRKECEDTIMSQFWRMDENMVIRFNLIGGDRASDYPDIDIQRLKEDMPPVMECQFVIKAGKRVSVLC
jgi:DNA repair exonuclease SbcCD nuclease subunit